MYETGIYLTLAFLPPHLSEIRIVVEIKYDSILCLTDNGILYFLKKDGEEFPRVREDFTTKSDLYKKIEFDVDLPGYTAFAFISPHETKEELMTPAVLIGFPLELYAKAIDFMTVQRRILVKEWTLNTTSEDHPNNLQFTSIGGQNPTKEMPGFPEFPLCQN